MRGSCWIMLGGLAGGLGVTAGAFGAHGLHDQLSPHALETFEVAVRYQLFHSLALVLVGLLAQRSPSRPASAAGWSFLLGILLFSGCLYGWALTGAKPWVWPVPVGGVAFIVGWFALAAAGWRCGPPQA